MFLPSDYGVDGLKPNFWLEEYLRYFLSWHFERQYVVYNACKEPIATIGQVSPVTPEGPPLPPENYKVAPDNALTVCHAAAPDEKAWVGNTEGTLISYLLRELAPARLGGMEPGDTMQSAVIYDWKPGHVKSISRWCSISLSAPHSDFGHRRRETRRLRFATVWVRRSGSAVRLSSPSRTTPTFRSSSPSIPRRPCRQSRRSLSARSSRRGSFSCPASTNGSNFRCDVSVLLVPWCTRRSGGSREFVAQASLAALGRDHRRRHRNHLGTRIYSSATVRPRRAAGRLFHTPSADRPRDLRDPIRRLQHTGKQPDRRGALSSGGSIRGRTLRPLRTGRTPRPVFSSNATT